MIQYLCPNTTCEAIFLVPRDKASETEPTCPLCGTTTVQEPEPTMLAELDANGWDDFIR